MIDQYLTLFNLIIALFMFKLTARGTPIVI